MEETILKRMYDLAYCAGVNNTTRPILKNKGLTYDECLQKIKDEQLILSGVSHQRELLKAFLEHYEDTIDFLPAEPSELIDDYFNSL
jgi:hypothetical protein